LQTQSYSRASIHVKKLNAHDIEIIIAAKDGNERGDARVLLIAIVAVQTLSVTRTTPKNHARFSSLWNWVFGGGISPQEEGILIILVMQPIIGEKENGEKTEDTT
jgi:hypothetical protein|tara:strand:+ start:327 stop:641 length:315 start_codon:yes stop_codon:yes gene_type:complete